MKAYLCARYDHRESMKVYAQQLQDRGIDTASVRWIWKGNEAHDPAHIALLDMEDLFNVLLDGGLVISFTETPEAGYTRGGRHVEYGIALGVSILAQNLEGIEPARLEIIGPKENVCHSYPRTEHYDTWEEFLDNLDKARLNDLVGVA